MCGNAFTASSRPAHKPEEAPGTSTARPEEQQDVPMAPAQVSNTTEECQNRLNNLTKYTHKNWPDLNQIIHYWYWPQNTIKNT